MLAASWVEVLRPEEILREIRANLDFLERDQRRGDDRHRSMRVVFDAAWERLGAEEREQFARMSVFRGGFTREAAQAITGASLRTLAALVRHCLLQRDPATGRYDVHELVRHTPSTDCWTPVARKRRRRGTRTGTATWYSGSNSGLVAPTSIARAPSWTWSWTTSVRRGTAPQGGAIWA